MKVILPSILDHRFIGHNPKGITQIAKMMNTNIPIFCLVDNPLRLISLNQFPLLVINIINYFFYDLTLINLSIGMKMNVRTIEYSSVCKGVEKTPQEEGDF
jgi:hypothetical protein